MKVPQAATAMSPAEVCVRLRRAHWFRGLDDASLARLVDHVFNAAARCVVACAPGDQVFSADTPGDHLFVVLDGEFAELSAAGDTLLWHLDAGDVVGEAAVFADVTELGRTTRPPRSSQVRCLRAGHVLAIPDDVASDLVRAIPEFGLAVVRNLATEAWRLFEDRRESDLVAQCYFDPACARLLPGPYRCEDIDMVVLWAQSATGDYQGFLPEGLSPVAGLDGRFMLVIASFGRLFQPDRPEARPFRYDETAFFIPSLLWHPDARNGRPQPPRPLFYVPAVYPDNFMATMLGREIYGFPKRPGQTVVTWGDDGRGTAVLKLDGAPSVWASFRETSAHAPLTTPVPWLSYLLSRFALPATFEALVSLVGLSADHLPLVPVANLKRIPGPRHSVAAVDYEVNELCESPFRIRRLSRVSLLDDVAIELGPKVPFAGGRAACSCGLRVKLEFDLLLGDVLKRYPRDRDPLA